MLSRAGDHRVVVEVPYRKIERDERSFRDDRLEVVDYDAATKRYIRVVDLNDPRVAMTQGLEPTEQDPRFHQQMVYTVASKVLENFDKALGRRLRFRGGERMRLFPHAFQGRNAYFDDELNAVLFGYFSADEDDPGPNLPGQLIFTCLSHDIIAHEVSHAALSRLHGYYSEPTNPEVPALHEAFADIVAMFQRLTFPEVVAPAIRESRGDLLDPTNRLLDIGAQFGAAAGKGGPLRRIAGKPNPELYARTTEPHDLGWILVSAVYEGFVSTYVRRTRDLVRLATGGSGRLPDGELHPDLIGRLTTECVRTAQSVLSMCIRATDYLPPVDPTFSDFLRAIVTADFELNRADDTGLRAAMIEAFRQRGIHPKSVGSLAVESLLLESESEMEPDPVLAGIVSKLTVFGARELERNYSPPKESRDRKKRIVSKVNSRSQWTAQQNRSLSEEFESVGANPPLSEDEEPDSVLREVAAELHSWGEVNRTRLGLDPTIGNFAVRGFHPVHRVASTGELLVEMVAHFVQTKATAEELGGLKYRSGITMIANIDGRVRYLIQKSFHEVRERELKAWVRRFDEKLGGEWQLSRSSNRIAEAFSARAMDGKRWK